MGVACASASAGHQPAQLGLVPRPVPVHVLREGGTGDVQRGPPGPPGRRVGAMTGAVKAQRTRRAAATSCRARALNSGSLAYVACTTLTATRIPEVLRARCTTPMPGGPRRVPAGGGRRAAEVPLPRPLRPSDAATSEPPSRLRLAADDRRCCAICSALAFRHTWSGFTSRPDPDRQASMRGLLCHRLRRLPARLLLPHLHRGTGREAAPRGVREGPRGVREAHHPVNARATSKTQRRLRLPLVPPPVGACARHPRAKSEHPESRPVNAPGNADAPPPPARALTGWCGSAGARCLTGWCGPPGAVCLTGWCGSSGVACA
ncbi:hypothetical protein SVIOM342S_04396 [Streptomyces violaceorubidus]